MDETHPEKNSQREGEERIMDSVAKMPIRERADLFATASDRRPRISAAIMEKDFWVCWMLSRIFSSVHFPLHLIFKGGTSLSKVFNAIERFSEDVDLSFDRRELGFETTRDPEKAASNKKRRALLDQLETECETVIQGRFVPALMKDFQKVIGSPKEGPATWSIDIDPEDKQAVLFHYPQAISLQGIVMPAYVSPMVRLELGARSDSWPAGNHPVTPYAADLFPDMFAVPSCEVTVLDAVRTFWEKATILHAQAHRSGSATKVERLSRHYYDLYQLSKTEIASEALAKPDLLNRVVEHKSVFFRSAWAHYETAKPGSFHLLPSEDRQADLRRDYAQMETMIFGDYPAWEEIIEGLEKTEKRINAMAS